MTTEAEIKTNPENAQPDPALDALLRLDTKVDEVLKTTTAILNELLALKPRVDSLEVRVARLEARVTLLETPSG
jgi:hypothetical protein